MKLKLRDVMTANLVTVSPVDTMEVVKDHFEKHDFHHLPVVNEEGGIMGIISKMDFVRITYGLTAFSMKNKEKYNLALYQSLLVEDVMTSTVACLDPDEPLSVAAGIFLENKFHAVPVCEKGKLVGIVTTLDLIRAAY